MSSLFEALPHSTLAADVAKNLRAWIDSGRFQPGEFLPSQKELAAQFGVGLSTIREAIKILTATGLVQSHPGKGTWVSEDAAFRLFKPASAPNRLKELKARQLYEARSVIEVALSTLAAERATPEEVQRILDAQDRVENALSEADYIQADIDFHRAVAAGGHNEVLEQFYHLVQDLFLQVVTELIHLPNVKEASLPLQRAIADAIARRDIEAAQHAAMEHMNYIARLLTEYE
jgi:GntR family transcriptional repressor for pyruvate dehydrogenase complex